jgi:amino acid adenylation domain-containing protein
VEREQGVGELLKGVREVCIGAQMNQDVPFEKLVEELQPERDLGRTPLFQVMFVLQNAPEEELELGDLKLSAVGSVAETARFDLTLALSDQNGLITGFAQYDSDLFKPATVERIVNHWKALMEAMVADPAQTIAGLSILSASETQEVLTMSHAKETGRYSVDVCIHHLVESQAGQTPDRVALIDESGHLTYAALNHRANLLASVLRRHGVGSEMLMGICLERSLDLIVALLGVLKAGGAYVPLDPGYPRQRLQYMLEHSRVKVLITTRSLSDRLSSADYTAVCLDDESVFADTEEVVQTNEPSPDNLAYVIYTSGSVGVPKGVMITHRSIANRLLWMQAEFPLHSDDVVLQKTAFSFDASIWEIFVPLLCGACLVLARPEGQKDGAYLAEVMAQQQVTILQLVPSMLPIVLEEPRIERCRALRRLFCGGEALPGELRNRLRERLPGVVLINLYGPTETSIDATFWNCESELQPPLLMPIGAPLENLRVYLLNGEMGLIPYGVSGDLYVGGVNLARGYIGTPDLTAERFIPDPFSPVPGERLYRTGDVARRRWDGVLEFLGRSDQQVKVRGYRIELDEIEATLLQHPTVIEAAVLPKKDRAGQSLVAYVVPHTREAGERADWQDLQVEHWQKLYDELYAPSPLPADPAFNTVGWNSSYTGEPIPAEEMREWTDSTVQRILNLRPRRVLEIGCGTGLLLMRLAPHVDEYCATDFSRSSLSYTENRLATEHRHKVRLLCRRADDFDGIEPGTFDCVVINSVVQYFPSSDYLLKVLEGAVRSIVPGGHVFVGDVRSLPLLDLFHTSVQLYRASPDLPVTRLRELIQRGIREEEELVLDPRFFIALEQLLPGVARSEIHWKRGSYLNELTRFRYDAILRIGSHEGEAGGFHSLDWNEDSLTETVLRQVLGSIDSSVAVEIRSVPNSRVRSIAAVHRMLDQMPGEAKVSDLQQPLDDAGGVDPEALWNLGRELSYEVEIVCSENAIDCYDAIFWRKNEGKGDPAEKCRQHLDYTSLANYANNPLKRLVWHDMVPQLISFLKERLPDYMVPGHFVLLDKIPILPNGKLDRKSLPVQVSELATHEDPGTPIQDILCGIWEEVLQVDKVGIHQDFFEAGGHSLLATQVISRIRTVFGIDIALRAIFEAPTISSLAERIENEKRSQARETLPLKPVSRQQALPLSFAQQRLWFMDQLEPANSAYNLSFGLRLNGYLHPLALKWSIQQIVNRHEVLRTRFSVCDGVPVQVISTEPDFGWEEIDLRDLPLEQREEKIGAYAREESAKPFDLEHGPLVRVKLLRPEDREYVLLVSMHHIITDGWSLGIIVRELTHFYEAHTKGEEGALPELPVQYPDFALWQRQWLQGEALEEQLAYWRKHLAGVKVLELLTDHPRSFLKGYRGAAVSFEIDEQLTARLKSLCRQEGATLFMALLAVFQMTLSRHAGQQDIAVGATVANRNRTEIERLIGFFVNTIVLRASIEPELKFRDLLKHVRSSSLEAYQYQDVPFEKLVEDLLPQRDLDRNPLFQSMFIFLNTPGADVRMSGIDVKPYEIERCPVRSDIDLYVGESGKVLGGRLVYDMELFESSTAQKMVQHFKSLLETIVQQPDALLGDIVFDRAPELPELALPKVVRPLSYHQERLWFIDRFENEVIYPSSPVYHNIPLVLKFEGVPHPLLLKQSIEMLVRRHGALQVRLEYENESARQSKGAAGALSYEVRDLAADAPPIDEKSAVEWASDESSVPFTIEGGPLLRAVLIRRVPHQALLIIVAHHLIVDRFSMRRIAEELAEIYAAKSQRRSPILPEVGVQFDDFAAWQRGLDERTWDPYWLYWKNQLGGERVNLELPLACPRHAIHIYKSAIHKFTVPVKVADSVHAVCARMQVRRSELLFACFYSLLFRYSGQEGFLVGISDPCRTMPGTEMTVGPMANLLALGGRPRNSSFQQLLLSLAKNMRQAIKYREMPFDLLVQRLRLSNDMSRTALFDVFFDFEETASHRLEFGALKAEMREMNLGFGKYDLNLMIQDAPDGFIAHLTYNSELYAREMIEQMSRHFIAFTTAALSTPSMRVEDVVLLSDAERKQQIEEWNRTAAGYPAEMTITQLFEAQALVRQDEMALKCQDTTLTFGELNRQANRLAHLLRKRGVIADSMVAICLDRSLDMVIAIFGVLKAGGAYLPIDPRYPEERVRFILEDAKAAHLITREALVGLCGTGIPDRILIDTDREQIEGQDSADPVPCSGPENVAYCIYTSGSTGKPNGVLVEHRQVVRLVKNDKFYFDFNVNDVWTLFHSYCFDFSVWELFCALVYGGTVIVVPQEATRDAQMFVELLRRDKVTVLNQTPASFQNVADEILRRSELRFALRYVIFGGEALKPSYLKSWFAAYPNVKLINMYGITETTVHVTFHQITQQDIDRNSSNIGIPIPTTTTCVLDANMQPMPAGVRGEIYVGGEGLARGYLNRPQLTALRFVPDPLAADAGSRLYRTGDLARYLHDGSMEYLGRIDHQVKVRGFRIELGEIEAAMMQQPGVDRTVVLLRPGQAGDPQLVAYVVAKENGVKLDTNQLRNGIREKLPEYMVPAQFMMLEKLPLTTNGKLDRAALPDPTPLGQNEAYTGPRNTEEQILCEIFASVLKQSPIDVHSNFFDLGGHSLLATQVLSRVRTDFQMELPLRMLFESPTVEQLAKRIQQEKGTGNGPSISPIGRVGREHPLPLSFAQERLWFLAQMVGASEAYHVPLGLRLLGHPDRTAMQQALNRIVARHEVLRTVFSLLDGTAVQRIKPVEDSAFYLVEHDLRGLENQQEELNRLVVEEATTPFHLETGPAIRGRLIRLAADEHALLITMHHIVSDGWSSAILIREFATLYSAFLKGEDGLVPELSVQYADYAVWQREWMKGEVLRQQADYWKTVLGDAPALLEIPGDHPRPAEKDYAGASIGLELDEELTTSLKDLSKRHGTTLYMALLAGWAALLARLSGQQNVVIGTPVANRGQKEIEELIGFFVNTLPLRVDFSDSITVTGLLQQVKARSIAAQQNQNIPFEQIVDVLAPERTLSHTPVFQVMFAWQNAPEARLDLPGLEIAPLRGPASRVAKFDLTLWMQEAGDKIVGGLEYASSLFERQTVDRYREYLLRLLQEMVRDDTQQVDRLPILANAEREQLLYEWNTPCTEAPSDRSIHQLFERQVEKNPDATALVFGEVSVSYVELNRRANRLAHYLRNIGVRPDAKAGICVERGVEMIVGILAILKSGGAYLPLDPGYPIQRLHYMLKDSAPVVLLTQKHLNGLFQEVAGALPTIYLEDEAHMWGDQPDTNLDTATIGLTPGHLAYVIYTSGSTGTPKGVLIEHSHVARLFAATDGWFQFDENDVWTLFHSYAFDFSVWEMWGALLYGGRLVVVSRDIARSPEDFYRLVCQNKVTILNQTPSAFLQFTAAQGASREKHQLRHIIFGGEALQVAKLRPWYEQNRNGKTQLVNMYGITETTVHVTYRPLQPSDAEGRGGSPVGCRIPDLRIYILDRHGEPVPLGVKGELYVSGAGVARGYWQRPELTAERLVPDPYTNKSGERMYKTGDLAMWLGNGMIEFIGRNDSQVKIRGFRIELGEIEARLAEYPGIREVAVVAWDEQNEKQLAAYYTCRDTQEEERLEQHSVTAELLREYLSARLPEYMVPAAYVRLDSLPLTANGKLDRKALLRPGSAAYALRRYEAPIGKVETKLAEIWAQVLKIGEIGRQDNFFALGGDSIRVIGIVSRIRDHGWTCNPQDIFRHQTIAALAIAISCPADEAPENVGELPALVSDKDRSLLGDDIEDAYSLSSLQLGMVFHNQLTPELGMYHDVFSHHLRIQDWDPETFHVVLDAMVQKHAVLRTSIALYGFSKPLQLVHRKVSVPVTIFDISTIDAAGQEKIISDWIDQEKRTTFDLEKAPLQRIFIHLRGPDTLQFTLSFHHGILDGWSVASFNTELFNEYAKLRASRQRTLVLAPLAATFKAAIALEAKSLQAERTQLFWSDYLADHTHSSLPPVQPDGRDHGTNNFEVVVPPDLRSNLIELANSLHVPPRTVLLAAHMRVIGLISGSQDVITGVVSHMRPQIRDSEQVLGLFLNTLPFRVALSPGSWKELIQGVFESELKVAPHQNYPYLQVMRDSKSAPTVETVFNYINFHVYDELHRLPGIEVLGGKGFERTNFPLTTHVIHQQETLRLLFAFDSKRLSITQTERLASYYLVVLRVMAAQPASLHHLSDCMSQQERRQVLFVWNDTAEDFPINKCLHEVFEEQVERTPEATALEFEDSSLSYAELNRRANRLAHHLQQLGVGPDRQVAICLERSLEMVIALFAVLKAGGAYLPLDPGYPAERLRYMLEDGAPTAVLTQTHLRKWLTNLKDDGDLPVLDLNEAEGDWNHQQETNLSRISDGVHPDNLAYVIYTSGSTGSPKGAMNQHRGVVNRLAWMQHAYPINARDAVLQKTPFSFDVSVWEFFWPLFVGSRLVIARPEGHKDPAYLVETIRRYGITTMHFVPSMLQVFVDYVDHQKCPLLRQVMCSGEALPAALVRRFYERLPHALLHNLYGPTEAAVDVTAWSCVPNPIPASIPIGRPIANTQIYILNESGHPVPAGVIGEIYISGVQVGRGYLKRPQLTAERFVPDPFCGEAGMRMYRTGDAGRWLPDGAIEFLGRNDHQIKIRGFRIELGEIEAALFGQSAIRDAVVVVRTEESGEKRLVAYVSGQDGGEPLKVDELRMQLRSRLPEHMLPSMFVVLEKLPLLPNGKVDRKSLPAPTVQRAHKSESLELPRNEIEAILVRIFAEVIDLEYVSPNDNFFDLGGDSIRSLRVLAKARQIGLQFELQDLFREQVASRLAPHVRIESALPVRSEAFSLIANHDQALLPDDVEDAYPLAALQAGMLYHMEMTPEFPLYHNVDSPIFHLPFNLEYFTQAVQEVVASHPHLRTSFHMSGFSEPLQWVHKAAVVPVQVEDLSHLSTAEQDLEIGAWFTQEMHRRFEINKAPLIRFTVHVRGPECFQLTISECHAAQDGWSLHARMTEVFSHYLARLNGIAPPERQALRSFYRDFVQAERLAIKNPEMRKFWEGKMSGATPFDIPRWDELPEQPDMPAFQLRVPIAPELSNSLRLLARNMSVPIKTILLAAHLKVMSWISGRTDVITGLSSNGRLEEPDGERVGGLFLNNLPFRFNVSPGSWRDMVLRVFHNEWEIIPYRRYPLAEIQKKWGRQQLFDSAFNFTDFHIEHEAVAYGRITVFGQFSSNPTNLALISGFHQGIEDEHIKLSLFYASNLMSTRQAERIAGYILRVMEAMTTDVEARHEDLSLLSEVEREEIVEGWNRTEREYEGEKSAAEMFEAVAGRKGKAIAVEGGGERWSYEELNRRGNQLARWLRKKGVGRETLVGVGMERKVEQVAVLLAVWKAGGGYVPLDAGAPERRVRQQMEQSGMKLLLTERALQEGWPETGVEKVSVDELWEELESYEGGNLERESGGGGEVAYVLYTSGSTGEPKGVMIEQRGLVNYLRWCGEAYGLGEGEGEEWGAVVHSPLEFDLTVTSLWGALLAGCGVVLVKKEEGVEGLSEVLQQRRGFRLMKATPAHLEALGRLLPEAEAAEAEAAEGAEEAGGGGEGGKDRAREMVKTLVIGGEALNYEKLKYWRENAPQTRVINEYGPTETVVGCSVYEVRAGEAGQGWMPIGRGIANARLYILDQAGQAVPVGVTGELYIGGAGVGRGYLGQGAWTAERFVPDGYGGGKGDRLYRTGDMARWRGDGVMEYLGRMDQQVKVRGYRIELGEIEAGLREHEGVGEAVVVVREDGKGEKRLVAYVERREGKELGVEQLREHLEERLPEYMVPGQYVVLEELPLTENGKIDRKGLPEVEEEVGGGGENQMPRTAIEGVLASIWAEVLQRNTVGIYERFFELGGDSIRSLGVMALARKKGLNFSLQQLFRHQTVAELARVVDPTTRILPRVPTEPFCMLSPSDRKRIPDGVEDAYPLAQMQAGLLYHIELSPDSSVYHNVESWHLRIPFDLELFKASVRAIIQRHPILRTSFDLTRYSEPMQLVHRDAPLPIEYIDLSHLSSEDQQSAVHSLFEQERVGFFDMSVPPMIRFHIQQLAKDSFQLTLTESHAILDGWSLHSMLTELFIYYTVLSGGQPAPQLPQISILYRDFVQMERQAIESEDCRLFWQKKLEGCLIARVPRSAEGTSPILNIRRVTSVSPAAISQKLHETARLLSVPLKTVLLAAHLKAIGFITSTVDVLTGLSMNGRAEEADADRVCGLLVNSLPFHLTLLPCTWIDLIRRTFEAEWEIIPYRRYPLAAIQKAWGREAIFETLFNYTHYHMLDAMRESDAMEVLVERSSTGTNMPLMAGFQARGREIIFDLFYDNMIIAEQQARNISQYYCQALAAIAENPHAYHDSAVLLSKYEIEHLQQSPLLDEYVRTEYLHRQFEVQAARVPDAIALVFEGHQLSYRELDRRATQLAHFLLRSLTAQESRIAICLERSLEMIVAILAILKTGSAYVPLDPGYPKDRISFQLQDCGATLLLTQASILDRLPEFAGAVVLLDDWQQFRSESELPVKVATDPDNLAYVIYTSGSTGRPKGVGVTHANVIRLFAATKAWYGFNESDVWNMFHSYAFDVSVWELWGAMLHGGRLVVVPFDISRSPRDFRALLSVEGVTILNQTPSAWRQFLLTEDDPGSNQLNLRLVIFAGEALEMSTLKAWFERHGDSSPQLVNMYGITETTVHVTYRTLRKVDAGRIISPIGVPIPDLWLRVLDENMQMVPAGVTGELYVGGPGLSRGYINNPELTASRFVPDPFASVPGACLYKSGDLVRRTPDGDMEYLGRKDHQVKIRGFRIELGEIEAAILSHPRVREAVVMASNDYGETRLTGFMTRKDSDTSEEDRHRVEHWRSIYDELYKKPPEDLSADFNIAGWNSSYSGLPIARSEMQEWLDHTVDQIRDLNPKRILEIGCGTGLLLLRLAPCSERYMGTDISSSGLDALQRIVEEKKLEHVTLLRQAADDFANIPRAWFDLVVINSVVQYFPSLPYLLAVLDGALNALADGGHILLGDLRNLELLEAFYTQIALARSADSQPVEELRSAISNAVQHEAELVIAPTFFHALQKSYPRISDVRVRLKRGAAENELTQFRYDVLLRVAAPGQASLKPQWRNWQDEKFTRDRLTGILSAEMPEALALEKIPNRRVHRVARIYQILSESKDVQLGEALRGFESTAQVVDPEDLRVLGAGLGYSVELTWSLEGFADCFNVVFARNAGGVSSQKVQEPFRALADYVNVPLRAERKQRYVSQLRTHLLAFLPDHMVPGAFVVLETLPLTANGKVDRKKLLSYRDFTIARRGDIVAPRNIVEVYIATIWEKVLRINTVGVTDSFFDLGGHSISALRVIEMINSQFGCNLPLSTFVNDATVERLASLVMLRENEIIREESCIVPLQRSGTRPPLFFVHAIGGGPLVFMELAENLGPNQPFYALRSTDMDQPDFRIEEMAEQYVRAIQSVQAQGPYLLGGFSFGGIVAFEIASQLQRSGHEVKLLAMLDCGAPQAVEDKSFKPVEFAQFVQTLYRLRNPIPFTTEEFEGKSEDEQLEVMAERAETSGVIPGELGTVWLRRSMRSLKSRLEAARNYVPSSKFQGRVDLFRILRPGYHFSGGPEDNWGWEELSTEPTTTWGIPGAHYTMLEGDSVQTLTRQLTTRLDQIQDGTETAVAETDVRRHPTAAGQQASMA